MLGSLKSFFPLDHEVETSLYLMEATARRHPRELANLTPSLYILLTPQAFCLPWLWNQFHYIQLSIDEQDKIEKKEEKSKNSVKIYRITTSKC